MHKKSSQPHTALPIRKRTKCPVTEVVAHAVDHNREDLLLKRPPMCQGITAPGAHVACRCSLPAPADGMPCQVRHIRDANNFCIRAKRLQKRYHAPTPGLASDAWLGPQAC